jgi:tetratricopeptide (TPR) repeat protein
MSDPVQQLKTELTAARKNAFQQTQRTNTFKTIVLILGLLLAIVLAVYYASTLGVGHSASTPRAIDDKEALRKLLALESELELLKKDLAPAERSNRFLQAVQAVAQFAIDNWVLLSFLAAVAIAIYVKLQFGIDYFESYRDLSTRKMLAEFYRQLGDRMMVYSEWEAAEAAYRTSLEINPTNIQATYGVAKASIFQPLKGQKFYAPEVADAKLDYLIEHTGADAQLYFLKAFNRHLQGDIPAARSLLQRAIQTDPGFVGSHLQLGYICQGEGQIEQAIDCYKKTLELDASYSLANNNLGFCYLITCQFPKAIEALEVASKTSPFLLTAINVGDAYRYAGDFHTARQWHADAVNALAFRGIEKERYTMGEWTYSYMPLRPGDTETIRQCVRVFTFEQKKMFALYALAFDLALLGELDRADDAFGQALTLDPAGDYRPFFTNKIRSILNLLKPGPPSHAWLTDKANILSPPPSDSLAE